jgi:hypothetical protein
VTTIADTFVYKADAYRVPEGSVLEELVKKLPGATVEDDGTIKINGKEVKKIMIDGKEFFTGDTKTAMKNIPTSMIEKVKAYDQQSDLARITGIDDGEEQTVLDIGVKPGMNKGAITNNDVGIGTNDRYSARLMGGYFTDKIHVMGFGNANNTNDMGFPGGGGGRWGGGRQGLNASKMFGVNFNYEKKNKLEFDGNVRWNHRDGDTQSKQSSENFVSTQSSFSNSHRTEMNRSNEWNSQFRLEWNPDTMTDIIFRPTLSYSTNDSHSSNTSASYNADPYSFSNITDPLSSDAIAMLAQNGAMVNTRSSQSISYSRNKALGGELQFNRRLNSHGRNITLRLTGNYSDTDSKSLSTSNVHLYKIKDAQGNDSTYQTNRYNVTPAKSWDYSAQFSYSEPIFKSAFCSSAIVSDTNIIKVIAPHTTSAKWATSSVASCPITADGTIISVYCPTASTATAMQTSVDFPNTKITFTTSVSCSVSSAAITSSMPVCTTYHRPRITPKIIREYTPIPCATYPTYHRAFSSDTNFPR